MAVRVRIRRVLSARDYTGAAGRRRAGIPSGSGPSPGIPRRAPIPYHHLSAACPDTRLLYAVKTYVANSTTRERHWLVVDANGQTLGRLATQIADALRGKRKPEYTPHVDTGDFVIVVNAEKISVSGNKRTEKRYYRHSGYPGGIKSRTLEEMLERRPEEVIRLAVKGMLPRNRLARKQLTKLKVYAGPDHPHAAQQPEPLEISS
jgi:large subunit ribosomal protein L13